jgi:hypothetical protein
MTITYENINGLAVASALEGLRSLWLTINNTDEIVLHDFDFEHNELVGEWVDSNGVPTGRSYRIALEKVSTIDV